MDFLTPYSSQDDIEPTEITWLKRKDISCAWEWIANIRNHLGMLFEQMGMHAAADYNKRIYLTILDNTRQDKRLEHQIEELEKAASRNVTVIIQFLDNWKARVRQHYIDAVPEYLEAKKEYAEYEHNYCELMNYKIPFSDKEQRKQVREEEHQVRKAYETKWSWIMEYMERGELNLKKLDKELEQEANRKYDFIIERTNAIVGQITDASNLSIGAKGDLNGFIIGTDGKAKVQTIGAGGYNIQCYHFRTLINSIA